MKSTQKRLFSFLTILLLTTPGLFFSCSTKEATNYDVLLAALLQGESASGQQGYYSRLYKITDISTTTPVQLVEVTESNAGTLVDAGKPKLVMVHGWLMEDSDFSKLPAPSELKKRITDEGFWGFFLASDEFALIYKDYDVYAYDYHSGYGVDSNGALLRDRLDAAFSLADNETVTIYAHSMGGLVTRFALYEDLTAPAYLKKILSTGSPYHGSPWASPEWQDDMEESVTLGSVLSDLTSFFTQTEGGSDLAWDNYDGSIVGASNTKLTAINAETDRDHFVTAWYGGCNMDPNVYNDTTRDEDQRACNGSYTSSDGDEGLPELGTIHTLEISCKEILGVVNGLDYTPLVDFNTADCVVPDKSAIKQKAGLTASDLAAGNTTYSAVFDLEGQDHFDMKMQVQPVRLKFVEFLSE